MFKIWERTKIGKHVISTSSANGRSRAGVERTRTGAINKAEYLGCGYIPMLEMSITTMHTHQEANVGSEQLLNEKFSVRCSMMIWQVRAELPVKISVAGVFHEWGRWLG
jgi:hypothetical protein